MLALEVLQTCPSQWKSFLSAIGGIDPKDSTLAIFDMDKCKPSLSHHLAFQVHITLKGKGIRRTVINESASTCLMSASCWLTLGSPTVSPPSNSLKAFDGHTFIPKGYLASFPITLAGKTIMVYVEVVDKKLDYNLFLGRSWTYAMTVVVSTVFCIIQFPLDGKVITVD